MIDPKVDSKPKCVICGEVILLHSHYRKEHKICRRYECMKTYRKQHASELDINRRAAQRTVKEQNDVEMVACAVCGERFQIIQHTHLRRHELTLAQYKQEFPFAALMTDKMKKCRGKGSVSKSRYLDYPGKQPDNYLFEFLTGAYWVMVVWKSNQKKSTLAMPKEVTTNSILSGSIIYLSNTFLIRGKKKCHVHTQKLVNAIMDGG
jgi:hypothetical protein